jgi:hypothetical protein
LAASLFTKTPLRMLTFDYSFPVRTADPVFIVKIGSSNIVQSALFTLAVFQMQLWIILFVVFAACTCIIMFSKYLFKSYDAQLLQRCKLFILAYIEQLIVEMNKTVVTSNRQLI